MNADDSGRIATLPASPRPSDMPKRACYYSSDIQLPVTPRLIPRDTMLEFEQSAAANCLRSGNLQLSFWYDQDRWKHALAVRGESGWQTVLTSVEGSPDQVLPPSPSFQDLRLEQIDDETGEFQLFGQAGKAVYSAAIRFDGRLQTISFDVAARTQREGAERCSESRYEVLPPTRPPAIGGLENVLLSVEGGTLGLAGTQPASVCSPSSPTGTDSPPLIVVGCHPELTSGDTRPPRNARWQYEIRFARLP